MKKSLAAKQEKGSVIKQKVMKHVKALEGGAVAQQRMEGEGVKKRHSPLKFRM